MKTLDEVIWAMEWCTELDQSGCGACPYADDDDLRCYADDALHYLRELRDMTDIPMEYFESGGTSQISCPKCHSEFVILPDANNPLTWSELKRMFHKPVWLETKTKKGWVIINDFEAVTPNSENVNVIHTSHKGTKCSHFQKHLMGKTWNAYRKERE